MNKFRIVQIISDSGSDNRKFHWVIQTKGFWGWREVKNVEGPKTNSVFHFTYEDAEKHLLEKYTGHGECIRSGNIYSYSPYNYHFC